MKAKDISGALKAYIAATKQETVSAEDAEERSKICRKCPKRIPTRGISRVSRMLADLARLHNSDQNIANYSCGICSCSLALLVPSLPENLHQDTEEQKTERLKTYCWMNNL